MAKRIENPSFAVAVTDPAGYLGSSLIRRLINNENCRLVLALGDSAPPIHHPKLISEFVDLADHGADRLMASMLSSHNIDTIVHLAFLHEPTHRQSWAHEYEAIGTLHVLNACAENKSRKIVMLSSTACYGPNPKNPNYLTEDHPLLGIPGCRFMDDKVEAERQLNRYRREHPDTIVTSLRMAPIIGPNVRTWLTRYLTLPISPTLLGYDPLVQLLHENDCIRALELAIENDVDTVVNIVGDGVLRLSALLRLCGRVALPLPEPLVRLFASAMWIGQLLPLQPAFIPFMRYLCVADGNRAKDAMGFVAKYSTAEAAASFKSERTLKAANPQGVDS